MSAFPLQACNGSLSVFFGIPYRLFPNDSTQPPSPITDLQDNPIRFWVHIALVIACFLLAIVSLVVQIFCTIPYGKHQRPDGGDGIRVNQRVGFAISQILPGIILFTLTYFLSGLNRYDTPNIVMYCIWSTHYINRGIVDTFAARHAERNVSVWVPVVATLVNLLYHYTNAEFIGSADYCSGYLYDPRFIIGLVILIIGFIINRIADAQLICLRKDYKDKSYEIPKGCLFYLISCPNYLAEMIEWLGWALMTWSLAGLVWFIFVSCTHIPRAYHNHDWYHEEFKDYPSRRRALLPFIY